MSKTKDRKKLTLAVDRETEDVVRETAERLGVTADRGTQKGKGSVSGMLNGLADGSVDGEAFVAKLSEARDASEIRLSEEQGD